MVRDLWLRLGLPTHATLPKKFWEIFWFFGYSGSLPMFFFTNVPPKTHDLLIFNFWLFSLN